MSGTLYYRLAIRDPADTFDALVLSSHPDDDNPFLTQPPKGDGESVEPLSGKVGLAEYVWRAADKPGTLGVSHEVFRQDFSDYADDAAFLAEWVENAGGSATQTWDLDATHVVSGETTSAHVNVTGTATAGDIYSVTKTVTGLTPGKSYTFLRQAYATEIVAGLPANQFNVLSSTVTADGSGNADLVLRFTTPAGGTFNVDIWFGDVHLIENEATARVITGLLADDTGKWSGVNRKCTGYESTDGSTWTAIHAGYLTQVTLTGGIEYALHVGDSDRRERAVTALVTIPTGTGWTGTNIVGAPPSRTAVQVYPPAWRFRVVSTSGDAVVLQFVSGWAMSSLDIADIGDPNPDDNVVLRLGDLEAEDVARLNAIAKPYAVRNTSRLWVFGTDSAPGLVATLTPAGGGTAITAIPYGFTLPFVPDFSGAVGGGAFLLALNTYLALKWDGTLPSNGTEYDVTVAPSGVSKDSPAHFAGHPVDFVTTLFDQHGIAYDSASAATTKTTLGSLLSVSYRLTATFKLWESIEKWAFGPFGFAVRKNTSNEWEFYTTRVIPANEPSETLDEAAIYDPERAILDLSVEQQVNRVVWKMQDFRSWTAEMGGDIPPDGIVAVDHTFTVNSEDVGLETDIDTVGEHSLVYEVPGTISPYPIDPDLGVWLVSASTEILRRWARGCPTSDIAVLRDAGITAELGEFVVVDLDHKPTIDTTQTVPGVRGGARICQVTHRTLTPDGPVLALLDVGTATTNALVPAFTLAQGTDTRHASTLTLTNSASLAGYSVEVQVNTGASEPSGGTSIPLFDPDAVAHDLPLQGAGSTVWARARVVKADELPGAWSDWSSVALDAVPPVTGLANAAGSNDTERVLTWTVGDATLPVRVRWKATADATYLHSVTLPAGSITYTITGIVPGTAMTAAVDHVENSPFTGDSADETTTWTAGSTTPTLTAPTNPQGFTDGAGTYGLRVTASVLPSRVSFMQAVETAVGSGTYGTPVEVGNIASVAGASANVVTLTRANDGLRVQLTAHHEKTGYTDSSDTAVVTLDPWETTATVPVESSDAAFAIVGSVPASLPNGRQLVDGVNTEVDTATAGEVAVNIVDSPAFAGTPTAPTAASGTNTTQIATTAFVQDAVTGLSSGGCSCCETGEILVDDATGEFLYDDTTGDVLYDSGDCTESAGGDSGATTVYIATTGSDTTGDGSFGSPWATLAHARASFPASLEHLHTVEIADGTYAEPILIDGFVSVGSGAIRLHGNDTTPGNVQFTGTTSADEFGVSVSAGAFIDGAVRVQLAGLEVNVIADRGIWTRNGAMVLWDGVTFTGTLADGARISQHSDLEIWGDVTLSGFTTRGIAVTYQSRCTQATAGTVTVNGPGGATTAQGIIVNYQSQYLCRPASGLNISITGVQIGFQLGLHGAFQHIHATGTITIDNATTPSSSSAIQCTDCSTWSTTQALVIDHFSIAFEANSISYIEASGSRTLTNVGTTSADSQNSVIYTP